MDSTERRFWSKVEQSDGCWTWKGRKDNKGYGRFDRGSHRRGERETLLAHRAAWEYEHGIKPALGVLHHCDNPQCVRPSHLFVGTQKDNMRDAAQKGRIAHGERGGHAKLTETDVAAIKKRRLAGETQQAIAQSYGVARSLVSLIQHGKRWAHAHV